MHLRSTVVADALVDRVGGLVVSNGWLIRDHGLLLLHVHALLHTVWHAAGHAVGGGGGGGAWVGGLDVGALVVGGRDWSLVGRHGLLLLHLHAAEVHHVGVGDLVLVTHQ